MLLRRRQQAVLQVGKPGSAIRLPFDEFQAIDVPFHRSSTELGFPAVSRLCTCL